MCSMICQTGKPLPDWPGDVTSHHPCNIFQRRLSKSISMIIYYYMRLSLCIIFFTSTNKHISYYLMSVRKFYGFYLECPFKLLQDHNRIFINSSRYQPLLHFFVLFSTVYLRYLPFLVLMTFDL